MNIHPIAHIRTPYREKFSIPRQASIVREAYGTIHFGDDYHHIDSLKGLTEHSHYWLIWGFHQHVDKQKALTVRPPRLGGNHRVGVFATRSPFRPNNLGLSVVKREHVDLEKLTLTVSGVDMLNDTPIYDIKPYIPYADAVNEAHSDWAGAPPKPIFSVEFLPEVERAISDYDQCNHTRLFALVSALLTYDARPAYKARHIVDDKVYATTLYDMNIAWQILGTRVVVISATPI